MLLSFPALESINIEKVKLLAWKLIICINKVGSVWSLVGVFGRISKVHQQFKNIKSFECHLGIISGNRISFLKKLRNNWVAGRADHWVFKMCWPHPKNYPLYRLGKEGNRRTKKCRIWATVVRHFVEHQPQDLGFQGNKVQEK